MLCVLRPLKLVIDNYPEGDVEWLDAPYFPRDVGREGSRSVPFSRLLWIEQEDFHLVPPPGSHRLTPGAEVRLRYGYVVRCQDAVVDPATREILEVHCVYDPATRGGSTPDGRRIAGTIHWVSAAHALPAEVRVYDRLFRVPDPEVFPEGRDFIDNLNPDSLVVLSGAKVEPSVAEDAPDMRYQFERNGYFWRDPLDSAPGRLVFNRIVQLRDTWSAGASAGEPPGAPEPTPGGRRSPQEQSGSSSAAGGTTAEAGGRPRANEAREAARRDHPRLAERLRRYTDEIGLSAEHADVLTGSLDLSEFFEEALAQHGDAQDVAAWVVGELPRVVGTRSPDSLPFPGGAFGRLVALVAEGRISRLAAREVLGEMAASGDAPEEVVRRRGLEKVSDDEALVPLVEAVLAEWPDKVGEYRGGKSGLLGFFVGQVVRRTGGKADPVRVRALLQDRLGGNGEGA